MIADPKRLHEVLEEIADWTIDRRREYLADMRKVFGEAAERQLKDGLTGYWKERRG
ncbi:hypothetical protein [Paraburkholderia panacisoli]|uniref:hypothetical protein n=1 Tax=Paraburkholderia panacisoli TaxID=2603818 RepID=UPI00165F35CE|nr:hypothetical protein [Paraburkholderia panacisoli]